MKINKCTKASFSVIGKEGSTRNGKGFILKLWKDVNEHYSEILNLVKKDDKDNLVGIWGLMSDFSKQLKPWEDNFSKGVYLAGVEVDSLAVAPVGWKKWNVPSFEYLYVENNSETTFSDVISYIKEKKLNLVAAAFDYVSPLTNIEYIYFPIKKL